MHNDFFLTQWLFLGMRWLFENITGESIALTVVISTILIKAITVFGDIKSRKSSAKMQVIQPQMNKLQKKYENDPQRLQREMSKLMKENNVSMFGGCLPMLFTLPLFFMFIAAFRQWGNEMMVHLIATLHTDPEAGVEMFKNFQFLWVHNIWQPDSGMQPVITSAEMLFTNSNIHRLFYFTEHLEAFELFKELGFFVESTAKGSYNGVVIAELTDELIAKYDAIVKPCVDLYAGYNNGWFVLPLLCGGTTLLSAWLMQRGQAQPAGNAASTGKMMMYLMPIMTFVFSLSTNASFALYWTVSNVISMITTYFINKSIGIGPAAAKEVSKT